MEDAAWLADYLHAYDNLLYRAYRDQTPGEDFAAACRELKAGFSHKQLILATIFELAGTYKIMHEGAERWGDTRQCRQVAWESAVKMLQELTDQPISREPMAS